MLRESYARFTSAVRATISRIRINFPVVKARIAKHVRKVKQKIEEVVVNIVDDLKEPDHVQDSVQVVKCDTVVDVTPVRLHEDIQVIPVRVKKPRKVNKVEKVEKVRQKAHSVIDTVFDFINSIIQMIKNFFECIFGKIASLLA